MRYNPDRIRNLIAVTSPPYDVMDRAMIDEALESHPLNIVRLILPRLVSDPNQPDPYARAAGLLRRWRSRSVLVTDPTPGLYVYEYGDVDHTVCGLVGAVSLRPSKDRVILPHEEVTPWVVADRLEMLTAMPANLEPILLVYDGDATTADLIDVTRRTPPLVDLVARDRTRHRLWTITRQSDLRTIADALAPHQALIADGHHRYATYRRLRSRHHRAGDGAGPWDDGLALLIDHTRFPLTVEPIHRALDDVALDNLVAPPGYVLSESTPVEPDAPVSDLAPDRPGGIVITDGQRVRRLARVGGGGEQIDDIELLNAELLPAWGVGDDRISFHHRVDQALDAARVDAGVAILLAPSSLQHTMTVARAGRMMPRKSTSFGPKPRMGVVMRHFDDA
jgi:uncharacterized protein (DUF1015 family)